MIGVIAGGDVSIELRHLRYFTALLDAGSFRQASRDLLVAQSALSKQMRQTEATLGVQLLVRTPRGVTPTPAGEMLSQHARRILAEVDDAVLAVHAADADAPSPLRIGVPACCGWIVPALLDRVAATGVTPVVSLRELGRRDLLAPLRRAEIDVGILCTPDPPPDEVGVGVRRLARLRMVAALPAGHPLARRTSLQLSALREASWIRLAADLAPAYQEEVVARCERSGFVPAFAAEAESFAGLLELVGGGLGVQVLPGGMPVPATVRAVPLEGETTDAYLLWSMRRHAHLFGLLAAPLELAGI